MNRSLAKEQATSSKNNIIAIPNPSASAAQAGIKSFIPRFDFMEP